MESTDTNTSTGQANIQALTCRGLDMVAHNLTSAFTEQLRAIVSDNTVTPYQQVLADITDQIKNLKERIESTNSSSQKSDDLDTQISRKSKRNRKKRE